MGLDSAMQAHRGRDGVDGNEAWKRVCVGLDGDVVRARADCAPSGVIADKVEGDRVRPSDGESEGDRARTCCLLAGDATGAGRTAGSVNGGCLQTSSTSTCHCIELCCSLPSPADPRLRRRS